ncbi:MAG: PHB depolymerase family esterase, partial [Myxococcales bacterium]|nr:PHB depolymerase family esterase [Myxococcales bacterium]
MRRLLISLFVVSSCGFAPFEPALDDTASARQGLDAVTGFGANPGNLLMFRFVPAGLPANRPLVVLLHGCGDTAANFSTGSGLEAQATARRFALLVPQQQTSNNFAGCFNWFDSANQARNSGELASIVQMIDRMVSDVGSDPQQVFVVGFSAGAAETSNLLAAHPDRFRAGAIVAGVPYKCTDTLAGAQGCLDGVDQTPATWGMRVRAAFPGFSSVRPRVAVWHGLMDTTVAPLNRLELVQQWTNVAGIDQVADGTAAITSGGTRTFYRATASGTPLVELNEVPGLGHVWRTAWATDLADFFGLTAGSGGGAAGGGAAGGGAAGGSAGGAAAGGAAGGGAAGG